MTNVEESTAPDWLATFLLDPPLWFKAGLVVLAVLVVGLAARRVLQRDLYIERDEQRAMGLILATAVGVAMGVVVSMGVLGLGYAGDVLVGVVAGFAAVEALRWVAVRVGGRVADEPTQLIAMWLLVAGGGIALRHVARAVDTPAPPALGLAVLAVAAGMTGWTILQEYGDGETVGEAIREA